MTTDNNNKSNFKYDNRKFSNKKHNRRLYYTVLASFNTLIILLNLVKSEIKSGNKLQPYEKLSNETATCYCQLLI